MKPMGADRGMDVRMIRKLARNQRGATAIEYSLIAGMIFLAIVTGVRLLGANTSNVFSNVGSKWSNAAN